MSEDNSGFLQVKSVWFSGKHVDYERWAFKFLMVAQVKGFKTILLGTETAPKSTEVLGDSKDPVDKEKHRLRKANDNADDDVSFGALYNSDRTSFQSLHPDK